MENAVIMDAVVTLRSKINRLNCELYKLIKHVTHLEEQTPIEFDLYDDNDYSKSIKRDK